MRPPFPRKLEIGPHRFAIRREAITFKGRAANGLFNADDREMVVSPHLCTSLERETLLHELFHAAWHCAFPGPQSKDIARLEEPVVTVLAPLILDALRRNPTFTARLLESDHPSSAA